MKKIRIANKFKFAMTVGILIGFSIGIWAFSTIGQEAKTYTSTQPPQPVIQKPKQEAIPTIPNYTQKVVHAKITHYCKEPYAHICNNGDWNNTALGTRPTVGRTVAVDNSMIPLGTAIIINGIGYLAEDSFGSDKSQYRVDVLVKTHKQALKLGSYYQDIIILEER